MKYIKKKRNMMNRKKRKEYASYFSEIRPYIHWEYRGLSNYYVVGEYDAVNNVFFYKKPKKFRMRTLVKQWKPSWECVI